MKKLFPTALLIVSFVPAVLGAGAQNALPERYRTWLDEEVVYIITKHERDVFLQLQTDREREIFIGAFWKQRDPTPGTPRNEYREEHEARLQYANKMFGRSSPLPGWKTDRGRIYIILGPPRNIEQYTNVNGVYPCELWFYLGDPALGLPTAFNLIFFKRGGTGDYILYSPSADGPRSLIAESMNMYANDQAAYKALKQLEPNLAPQTLSLIPGEQSLPGMESLSSISLLADIAVAPQKQVAVDYADAILRYKDFIEVDYSANYIPSEAALQVIGDASGGFRVHYSIEPGRLSVEEDGGKYGVRLQITGRVSDERGRTVYQYDKDFSFSLTGGELEDARAKSVSIQDSFPLVAGTYRFDILLKNTISKEFTGTAQTIFVPGPGQAPALSPLLLAYGVEARPSPSAERVPFKVGDDQILCQARKTFGAGAPLVLFYQVYGLTDGLKASGAIRTEFLREDKPFLTRTARTNTLRPDASVLDVQPLANFPPGYYQARVTLVDGDGKDLASAKESFEVSPVATVPRPMVVSRVDKGSGLGEDLYVIGVQLANEGHFEAAKEKLAEAHARAPERPDIAVAYAQALFQLKDYAGIKDVLTPFAGDEAAVSEIPALLGQACHALGQYDEAAKYYSAYITRFGANIDILNYLGTCHYQLGNTAEALKAWTKSLELNPNQEKLKALVDSLKKK